MKRCDNISALHWPEILSDQGGAIVAHCRLCHDTAVFRTDADGRFNSREYRKWFARDFTHEQPLYYKYHESQINVL